MPKCSPHTWDFAKWCKFYAGDKHDYTAPLACLDCGRELTVDADFPVYMMESIAVAASKACWDERIEIYHAVKDEFVHRRQVAMMLNTGSLQDPSDYRPSVIDFYVPDEVQNAPPPEGDSGRLTW